MIIRNGVGDSTPAEVTDENQLSTIAVIKELQHHVSKRHGRVYQIIGEHTLVSAGTKTLLHLINNDPNRNLIISYMRLQYPGGDGNIDGLTYFQLGFESQFVSGGVAAIPVNVNSTSGKNASITAYQDNPTVTGTLTGIDKWFPDKSMMTFNKHGSIILGLGDSIEWRLVTDQTTGLAYTRITFMMMDV